MNERLRLQHSGLYGKIDYINHGVSYESTDDYIRNEFSQILESTSKLYIFLKKKEKYNSLTLLFSWTDNIPYIATRI